jgi:hypothetical protein
VTNVVQIELDPYAKHHGVWQNWRVTSGSKEKRNFEESQDPGEKDLADNHIVDHESLSEVAAHYKGNGVHHTVVNAIPVDAGGRIFGNPLDVIHISVPHRICVNSPNQNQSHGPSVMLQQ